MLGISRVIVFAKDMECMSHFYQEVVGLSPIATPDDPAEFRSFDAGGAELSLHRVPERFARDIEILDPPQAREGTPIKIVFRSKDLVADRSVLVARGARMGPIREFGDLWLCDGIDPEGNVFQLSNRV